MSFLFECPNSPDVPSKVNAEVATDATRLGSERLSLTKHLAALLDHILSLPAHTNDRSRREELAQPSVEALGAEIDVMSLGHFKCRPHLYTSLEEEVKKHCNMNERKTFGEILVLTCASVVLLRSTLGICRHIPTVPTRTGSYHFKAFSGQGSKIKIDCLLVVSLRYCGFYGCMI